MHLLHIVCKRTNSRKWFQLVLEEVLKTLGDKQHKFKFVGGDFFPLPLSSFVTSVKFSRENICRLRFSCIDILHSTDLEQIISSFFSTYDFG